MTWYNKYSFAFTNDPRFKTHFELCPSAENPPLPALPEWRLQVSRGERLSNPPTGLRAVRQISETGYPGLLDFLSISSKPVVSDKFRELVEGLERDKHQFIRIALYDEVDGPIDQPYWILNTLQAVDAVIYNSSYEPDQRAAKWRSLGREIPDLKEYGVRHNEAYMVDAASIRGLHLWRDTGSPGSSDFSLFFSDELVACLRNARLRGITLHRAVLLTEAGLKTE